MDARGYLARLRYDGDVGPTLEVLFALQKAHLLAVPFENLDIHAGRRIVLDPEFLFNKIVVMNRGGFCYELNGLFHLLLQTLGFRATLAMGRVYDRDRNCYGADFDHMLVLVEIAGETWLADVGFGDFAVRPLKLALDQPVADSNGQFVIERHNKEYLKVSRHAPEENRYVPEYLFSTTERALPEFADMCLYHQTSPESHFTRQRVCSIATPTGRVTLTDSRLIVTDRGIRNEQAICSKLEFDRELARHFNIVV